MQPTTRIVAEAQLDAFVIHALALEALAEADVDQTIARPLLDQAGAHPRLAIFAAAIFDNDALDAGHLEKLRQHQAGRAGADNSDLGAQGHGLAIRGMPKPARAGQPRSQSMSAALTASGCSMVERWPQSGMMASFAPGMPRAISFDRSGGVRVSLSPTRTRVGHLIEASNGREFRPGHDGALLLQEAVDAGVARHVPHDLPQARIVLVRSRQKFRRQQVDDVVELALFRHPHQLAPPNLGFVAVRPRLGVEQGKPRHPLRSRADNSKGDVAAIGKTGERKALRRRIENATCDTLHAVVAAMIGDRDGAKRPERRQLRRVKPRAAKQAWNQDKREADQPCGASLLKSLGIYRAVMGPSIDFRGLNPMFLQTV